MTNVIGKVLGKGKRAADELSPEEIVKTRINKLTEKADAVEDVAPGRKPVSSAVEMGDDGVVAPKAPEASGKAGSLLPGEQEVPDLPEKGGGLMKKAAGATAVGAGGAAAYNLLGGDEKKAGPQKPYTPSGNPALVGGKQSEAVKVKVPMSVPEPKFKSGVSLVNKDEVMRGVRENELLNQDEDFRKMSEDFQKELNLAYDLYKQTKDEVAAKEMWEGIMHGVATMAAGAYGSKHGMDLSGVKFDKTDWDKKREMAREELRTKIENAKAMGAIKKEGLDRAYNRTKDKIQLDTDLAKMGADIDARNADAKNRAKAEENDFNTKMYELKQKQLELSLKGDAEGAEKVKQFIELNKKIRGDIVTAGSKEASREMIDAIRVNVDALERTANELGVPLESLEFRVSDFAKDARLPEVAETALRRRNKFQGRTNMGGSSESTPAPASGSGKIGELPEKVQMKTAAPGPGYEPYLHPKTGKTFWVDKKNNLVVPDK